MPAHILDPRCMFRINPDHSILIVQPSIEHFDDTICETRSKGLRRPRIGYNGSNWTLGIGIQILEEESVQNTLDYEGMSTYHDLSFCCGIPGLDHPRVSAN